MTASASRILATSAGLRPHPRLRFGFGPMMALATGLAHGDRICVIDTVLRAVTEVPGARVTRIASDGAGGAVETDLPVELLA